MTDSIKMAKLDLITMKPQWLSYLTIIPIILIFEFMQASITVISFTIAWAEALLVANIFIVQEKNELDRLYNSLSITSKDVVLGRYASVMLIYIISFIISISLFAISIRFNNINLLDTMLGFSSSFLIFSIIIGIQFPIYFKMGYIKSKIWITIAFLLVILLSIPFISVSSIIEFVQSNRYIFMPMGILISCVILFISCQMSFVLYHKCH